MVLPQHTTRVELSQPALKHNVDFIRQLIGDKILFSSVVKGNAYGHGIKQFCEMAVECGIGHFSTYSADEAYQVWKATDGKIPIMIMGFIDPEELEWVVAHDIDFFVFEEGRLRRSVEVANKLGKKARVHIEFETGMNRTGMPLNQLKKLLGFLDQEKASIEFRGVCTHFAGAESVSNYFRVKLQQKRFRKVVNRLYASHQAPPMIHAACSAATMRYPTTRYNMVRIGILQYGFFPSREILVYYLNKNKKYDYPLKRIITWKSKVMDLKKVKAGEFIGYGNAYFTNVETTIALVPVGYAHGFSRALSNQGKVLIRGQRLNVVGIVNMNLLAVDVTRVPKVEKQDEVILIGSQGDSEISVTSFSDISNLLNYEMLTRLPHDIPRIVIKS